MTFVVIINKQHEFRYWKPFCTGLVIDNARKINRNNIDYISISSVEQLRGLLVDGCILTDTSLDNPEYNEIILHIKHYNMPHG